MPSVKQIHVRCGFCRIQFPCHIKVRDTDAFERLADAGGILECPECHRFIVLDRTTMVCTTGDDG